MPLTAPTWITAVATVILGAGAIVTAIFAILAFRKQSLEVRLLQQGAAGQQALIEQQAEAIRLQANQIDLQRQQFSDQQDISRQQAGVLELQAAELQASLEERKRDAKERRRTQASQVFITQEIRPQARYADITERPAERTDLPPVIAAQVHNSSGQPIYNVEIRWHRGTAPWGEPNPEPLPPVMPQTTAEASRRFTRGTSLDASGAVMRFTDAAGDRWQRRPDGDLQEQQP
jgi:hypothetical protein